MRDRRDNPALAGQLPTPLDPFEVADAYRASGWWDREGLVDRVAGNARKRADGRAFAAGERQLTWAEYDQGARQLAAVLASEAPVGAGVRAGERVAVWLPDTPTVHVAYLAVEHCGGVVVGVGARAGERELRDLLRRTGTSVLVTMAHHRGRDLTTLKAELGGACPLLRTHVIVPEFAEAEATADRSVVVDGARFEPAQVDDLLARLEPGLEARKRGPDALWLINSTSGTTGRPKCVLHNQNRWAYFHKVAARAGRLDDDDVFLSALPAPFGFGLWTAHVTPTVLGAPCVLLERFSAEAMIEAIERYRVTVLACVSSQFMMMLNSPALAEHDVSSLKVMFTGGESVPYERALQFEQRTGAALLQFFGSNETGALSCTTVDDPQDRRLTTAGRVLPEMQVRLFDEAGRDVTREGRGRPAGRGPATCLGYLEDDAANRELFTADGWMLMGDLVTVDAAGYLTLVGRTSDIVIRGGKNVSAATVEEDVASHPAVAVAAAVPMPDPVLGERVCVFVELFPGAELSLDALVAYLRSSGVSPEQLPERLEVRSELPRSAGRKIAKGALKAEAAQLVEQERLAGSSARHA